jgi:hypothetical protein
MLTSAKFSHLSACPQTFATSPATTAEMIAAHGDRAGGDDDRAALPGAERATDQTFFHEAVTEDLR